MIVLIGFRDTKAEYHLAYERRIGDLRARSRKVGSDGEHEIIDASHHSGTFQQRLVAAPVGVRQRGGYFYASAVAVNTVERQRNPRTGFPARGVQYVCSKPAHRPSSIESPSCHRRSTMSTSFFIFVNIVAATCRRAKMRNLAKSLRSRVARSRSSAPRCRITNRLHLANRMLIMHA